MKGTGIEWILKFINFACYGKQLLVEKKWKNVSKDNVDKKHETWWNDDEKYKKMYEFNLSMPKQCKQNSSNW